MTHLSFTTTERARFDKDASIVGERAAWWLARETQGWSALDELVYWARVQRIHDASLAAAKTTWCPYTGQRITAA